MQQNLSVILVFLVQACVSDLRSNTDSLMLADEKTLEFIYFHRLTGSSDFKYCPYLITVPAEYSESSWAGEDNQGLLIADRLKKDRESGSMDGVEVRRFSQITAAQYRAIASKQSADLQDDSESLAETHSGFSWFPAHWFGGQADGVKPNVHKKAEGQMHTGYVRDVKVTADEFVQVTDRLEQMAKESEKSCADFFSDDVRIVVPGYGR